MCLRYGVAAIGVLAVVLADKEHVQVGGVLRSRTLDGFPSAAIPDVKQLRFVIDVIRLALHAWRRRTRRGRGADDG